MSPLTIAPVLCPGLYLGDGGRCTCHVHAGASARFTGRDISGQPVYKLTASDLIEAAAAGARLRCETCGSCEV